MKYKESEEMYLETILLIQKRKGSVRSVDIVHQLGYAKSSVSRAVNLLEKRGYIVMDLEDGIVLTKTGLDKANYIYQRHQLITQMLIKIGSSEQSAEENACRIEHVITDELFEVIKKFIEKD